ncbi:putative tetratricopeptide-like helical domain superfamily [Helianthus debilis subsp. tardiflorus]
MVDALRLKDEMVSNGVRMNLVVATSLMKGYCVKGDLDSALNFCCNTSDVKKGFELYTRMKNEGIKPNVYNVNSLIIAFFEGCLIDEAKKLFDEVVETGVANVFTYNNLISWLCKADKVDEACGVLDKMSKDGISPMIVS